MINNPLKLNESKYSGLSMKIVDKIQDTLSLEFVIATLLAVYLFMKPSLTISSIVADFKQQANDGVSILYDAHDVVVCADRDQISQVIHNLISNA